MGIEEPHDLLIECADCGVENIFSDYTPRFLAVCNQCRARLVQPDFNKTHNEYRCNDCGFVLCLSKDTPFEMGKTACRCQSLNIRAIAQSTFYENAEKAGAFAENEQVDPNHDWCRPDVSDVGSREDYNEIFDQDPGNN